MQILFTICARAGSKGIKDKNLKMFLGFLLPYYTLSAIDLFVSKTDDSYDIVLSTDSDELIAMFENDIKMNIDIVRRQSSLAMDDTPKPVVILDCIKTMSKRKSIKYDMVVDLDITSPLRTVKNIEELVNKKKQTDADVVFSVTTSRRNPYFNMVKKTDNGYKRVIKSNFAVRQQAPEIYDMNASMYAYDPIFLEKDTNFLNGKCDVIHMMDTGVLDLDHLQDFELMQVIAEWLFKNNEQYNEIRTHISDIVLDS